MEKLTFLKSLSLFQGQRYGMISSIEPQFSIKMFKTGKMFYKEDDIPNYLYFIKEGEVEISKMV
jgi:CRP-like cAMP-binding protein